VTEDQVQATVPEDSAAELTRADTWANLMVDRLAFQSHRQLFDDAMSGIRTFVANESRPTEVVGRVLAQRSGRVSLDRALGEVTEGLVTLLGTDAAYLLHWLIYAGAAERLEDLVAEASPDVATFLREVVAEYGPVLDRVQGAAFAYPTDWSYIEKSGAVDILSGKQSFNIALTRWDGEVVRLQLSPDSLINLMSHLLELTNGAHSLSAFSPQALEGFTDHLVVTIELLSDLNSDESPLEDAVPQDDDFAAGIDATS
jgi:hypothetical protein